MAGESGIDGESVNVFPIEETLYFKHYFEGGDVFSKLREYYNGQQYRFEVPADEFPQLAGCLAPYGYNLRRVDDVANYIVAVEQYTAHPENIFKASVVQGQTPDYNCFLLKDKAAVKEAVYNGAEEYTALDIEWPF